MNLGFLRRKEFIWLILIAVIFVVLRLPAVDSPYHQDEYKWPMIVNPSLTEPGGIPHPPVGEFIYKTAGQTVGFDNFRMVPLIFSFVNLLLLFYLVKMIFNKKTAFWVASIFTISFYSVLASLMVDTDGAIMPFFFLIAAISYYKIRSSNFEINNKKWKWLSLLVLSVVLGFLVKISFALVPAILILDFAFEKKVFSDWKKVAKWILYIISGAGLLALVLYLSTFIFPFFRLDWSLKYWEHFAVFKDRGWLQTFVQFSKAILYSSPLLILPVFFTDREIFKKLRPFFLFIFIGLFFYLFLFDFSIGALDRYLQFLIIPLSLISGAVFAKYLGDFKKEDIKKVIFPLVIGIVIFLFQFLNHFVPSLYPKSEWINRILSGEWNFLFPFMGGSGPIPFYVSLLFIILIWLSATILIGFAFNKDNLKKGALLGVIILGFVYNGVFIEEHLFGKINGSSSSLVKEVTVFIDGNEDIKKVTVYNDNGGDEIQKIGKYRKRLYVDPKFDINDKIETLNKYKEHYLEIDIPRIGTSSVYRRYLDFCVIIYNKQDKHISAKVYDCRQVEDIKISSF